ncbi:AbiJ-NTD4 domain-containing protein [Pseudomonas asiatica]|uniref:AbiJ-NTD4 domain-containing protein n=1 Tax=Pseudomonas asiatica TaxID=2219225 RepID=UPI003877BA7A
MLTDVFFRRYANRPMFESVGPKESALFVQVYRIVNEQIWSYYGATQKVNDSVKRIWTDIHDRLAMEIGVKELSQKYYSYQTEYMGKPYTKSGFYDMNLVVEQWLNLRFSENLNPDIFIKRRLSFVELAFRKREEQVAQANSEFSRQLAEAEIQDRKPRGSMTIPGSRINSVRALNQSLNSIFSDNVSELNKRLKQAGMPPNYHNGYLQITQDAQLQVQVEQPFWLLVQDSLWTNVSIDMAEAIERRDNGGRDPSFYAAKALESTVKIICEVKNLATGNERGVSDFLNHLESKANGAFIEGWERQSMQRFYSDVRNDLGHGPGSKDMPRLTTQQIDQTIEFCMSWIKSLIKRL